MRVFRNASIDRLMTRRAEKLSQSSSVFDNYLTSFINNRNYGVFNSFNSFGTSNISNTSNPFADLNMNGVQFNLSYETKRQILNNRIEKAINSGEPLRGVSYSEYLMYYMEKNGSVDTDAQQFYRQDLKGDNAALRNKQWRTDPDYIIPKRLYNNSLIKADKEAALEKLSKNEKLEDWEQRLIDTI